MDLIVDVREREEYVQGHIKGAINIPLFDMRYHLSLLEGRKVLLYCNTGHRSRMAAEYLHSQGVDAEVIPPSKMKDYEMEGHRMLCAVNFLAVKPGLESEFEKKVRELCQYTYGVEGFLGSKIFRVTTISYGGSGLRGEYTDIKVQPTEYVMLTYWTSIEAHERFHEDPKVREGFMSLTEYLAMMPREFYAEILR